MIRVQEEKRVTLKESDHVGHSNQREHIVSRTSVTDRNEQKKLIQDHDEHCPVEEPVDQLGMIRGDLKRLGRRKYYGDLHGRNRLHPEEQGLGLSGLYGKLENGMTRRKIPLGD